MKNPYKRLRGSSSRLTGHHQLFAGPDHLLWVTAIGFQEQYRRLYYSDIQSFSWRRTPWGLVINVLQGVALLLVIVGAFASGQETIWVLLGACPFLLGLVVNSFKGATCTFTVTTGGQAHHVLAISRIPAARRFIAQIRPLIDAAQPKASMAAVESIATQLSDSTTTPSTEPPQEPPPSLPDSP